MAFYMNLITTTKIFMKMNWNTFRLLYFFTAQIWDLTYTFLRKTTLNYKQQWYATNFYGSIKSAPSPNPKKLAHMLKLWDYYRLSNPARKKF